MLISLQPQSRHAPPGSVRVLTPDVPGVPAPFDRSPVPLFPSPGRAAGLPPSGLVQPGDVIGDPPPLSVSRLEVIDPPANRLIELLKTHYPAFEQTHPLHDHVRQAMRLVTACHTAALGGHVERCPNGHIERIFYNSCGHRNCPRCAGRMRRNWLRDRQAKLLPVRQYHAVFTVPHAFNDLWHWNPRVLGDLLFPSATDALRALLADPRHLGAEPGITVTLETWDDRLRFHPHVHCLVTGGGITPEGAWKDVPNPRCLAPVTPLMWAFRKQFCQGLRQAVQAAAVTLPTPTTTRQWLNTINRVNRQDWEVFIAKPPEDGGPTTQDILRYLAEDVAGGPVSGDRLVLSPAAQQVISPLDRLMLSPRDSEDRLHAPQGGASPALSETLLAYLKSFPLSASRLEEAPEGEVCFRWGPYDPATGKRERTETDTLPVDDFLQRYLQHLPPPHYQTVRHDGLYASAKKEPYERCCQFLSDREPESRPPDFDDETIDRDAWIAQHTCPVCHTPLVVSSYIPSSVTGHLIPRVPLGHVFAPHSSLGGGHDP